MKARLIFGLLIAAVLGIGAWLWIDKKLDEDKYATIELYFN